MDAKSSKIGRRFEGKVAIVTASTQGIGFSIAHRLALEGASVVISSRRQRNVDEAVKKLKQQGIEVLGVSEIITYGQKVFAALDTETKGGAGCPILKVEFSTLAIRTDASPHLTKGSSIVFISSLSAFQLPSSMAMYGVTKTALLGLTKALATEMAQHTRVNCARIVARAARASLSSWRHCPRLRIR
ncbi:tropinone reductase-like protein 3 [Tanacetum coccineum]